MWVHEQLAPGLPTYNVPIAFVLRGPLPGHVLEQAFGEIVRRQEILRTRYPLENGRPLQRVEPHRTWHLPLVDLTGLAPSQRERTVRDLLAQDAGIPFDIAEGPIYRFVRLKLGPEESVVSLSVHHLAFDGWSMGVMARELEAAFEAFRNGEPSALAELSLRYSDVARWLCQQEQRADRLTKRDEWRGRLRDVPELAWPPKRLSQSESPARASRIVAAFAAEGVRALARREGATAFAIAAACLNVMLHLRSGQSVFALGTDVAGRSQADFEKLIGFFVNQVVLVADLTGEPTFRELLARVSKTVSEVLLGDGIAYDALVSDLGRANGLDGHLFRVKLVLQPDLPGLVLEGVVCEALPASIDLAKFDVAMSLFERGSTTVCSLDYREGTLTSLEAAQFLDEYVSLLAFACEHPAASLGEMKAFLRQAEQTRQATERRRFDELRNGLIRERSLQTSPTTPEGMP
jgi:hypothetical protein